MSKRFYEKNNHDKISNELAGDLMEESAEGNSNDVFIPSLCLKALDGNFLYGESVYSSPLFLDEGTSIDASQIGVQGQGLMAKTPQVALCHTLYEGNPIQSFLSSCLNHQKTFRWIILILMG